MRTSLLWWIVAIFLIALVGGGFIAYRKLQTPVPIVPPPPPLPVSAIREVIGHSVQGREIESFTYGEGDTHIVFVGGIHGGYEWNSVVLAYQIKKYLDEHIDEIPKNKRISIIPNANPDGVFKIVQKEGSFLASDVPGGDHSDGRFNANQVDLNRNFDCKWSPTGTWKSKTVSGGDAAFSEPESSAIRDFVLRTRPSAMIFWHSQAGGVYASQCTDGILPKTLEIMHIYAKASGYPAFEDFNAYVVHGASEDWLASIGIPAITVEFRTHEAVEWDENLAGVLAILRSFVTSTTAN
jgi:predicted deacylase